MISPSTIGKKQSNCAGRTVRDIVERNPEMVTEVWCRNIFRQLLQVLERQYTLQLPHRVISPDTVIFHDDGSPALLPSLISDPKPDLADDLTALARTVHYAITREPIPAAPLHGRALESYSASLMTAIDRSLAFDPARRPRTIGELRDLLGIVAFKPVPRTGPAGPATQATSRGMMAPAPAARRPAPASRLRRRHRYWSAAGILLAMGAGGIAVLYRPAGVVPVAPLPPVAHVVPRAAQGRYPDVPAVTAPAPAPPRPGGHEGTLSGAARVAGSGQATPPATSSPALAGRRMEARSGTPAARNRSPRPSPPAPAVELPSTDRLAGPPPAAPPLATQSPAGDAVFSLRIRPWGIVYVDGVRRGISPPLKQLVLAPGRHALRVTNPDAGNRLLEVDTAGAGGHIDVDFDRGPR
jgi:hypothetical protein